MKKHSRIVLAALAAIVSEVSVADDATAVACAKTLFGDNVVVFSPSDAPGEIDAKVESVFQRQHKQQFGDGRYALMFLPGDYRATKPMNVGYYTQLLGLGRSPTDVTLNNVKTPAALPNNNATCNFWVGIENLTIADTDNNEDPYFGFQWAVSQAAPARRLLVERKAVFDWFYGWASGGYVADCIFRKAAGSYSQQQYFTRNSRLEGKFYGINWNNVLLGCDGSGLLSSEDSEHKVYASAAACMGKGVRSTWSAGGSVTLVDGAPVIREKPFVFWDDATSAYKMFVPALRRNAKGTSWSESDPGKGEVLDIASAFHVATPKKDDAKSINAALAAGKHIFLTPGIYRVKEPIRVKRAGTVFFGLGEATIIPDNAEAGMVCSDEDGIVIAGVIFDAGERSRHLLVVGEKGSRKSHAENPIVLQDVISASEGLALLGAPRFRWKSTATT